MPSTQPKRHAGEVIVEWLVGMGIIGVLAMVGYFMLWPIVEDFVEAGDPSTPTRSVGNRSVPEEVQRYEDDKAAQFDYSPSQMSADPVWSCGYSPTYNHDWHDDVLCTNGISKHRPYLLSDQSFVTEAEMAQAAAEYENMLN